MRKLIQARPTQALLIAITFILSACSSDSGTNNQLSSIEPSTAEVPVVDTENELEPDPSASDMLENLDVSPVGDPSANNTSNLTGLLLPLVFDSQTDVDLMYAQVGAELVNQLNDTLLLPGNIDVLFADCGTANAFFVPGGINAPGFESESPNAIVMCHELTALFSNFYADPEQGFLASTFVLMHELGHALVHVLNLPVLGIEESYVDGVAAVFLGESGLAEGSILAGWFFGSQTNTPFFDSHRAGPQRLGDLACWGVGADASLLDDPFINDLATQLFDGGRNCVGEYQQQVSALATVLDNNILGGLNVLEAP